ncbi:Hypothetical protein NTJ_10068 [Nesidiocoris tenuis]|uniref:Uncharacterized protein n=1 Tax=Nesidiocoris tenuis TaxID=355587 RepID=A0ABN7AZ26_9HEMI|nr:Hypothetical protein NTJ_10068 [Nesidiocoris tenuis]
MRLKDPQNSKEKSATVNLRPRIRDFPLAVPAEEIRPNNNNSAPAETNGTGRVGDGHHSAGLDELSGIPGRALR